MTELWLIAHRVRGEPAFDIAHRIPCPTCLASDQLDPPEGCHECDDLGYWWIIPTSGHRAYPWWHRDLDDLCNDVGESFIHAVPLMPEGLEDHYPTRTPPAVSLLDALNLRPKPRPPSAPIQRRL